MATHIHWLITLNELYKIDNGWFIKAQDLKISKIFKASEVITAGNLNGKFFTTYQYESNSNNFWET